MMTPQDDTSASVPYILGHSSEELQRLALQAQLLEPITRHLLVSAGVGSGMRVLDIGCGLGDVTFLAAELVGSAGTVVGADRAPAAVTQATARAKTRSISNVHFIEGDPSEMLFDHLFDAVVGRYVLMYQSEPAVTLQALASRVKPGGIIVFHELDWGGVRSSPPAPTYDQCCRWVIDALRHGSADPYMGTKLYSAFVRAGLPAPIMHLEAPIGGPADPSGNVMNLLETIFPKSLVKTLEQFGVVKASEINAATLAKRMYEEIRDRGSVIVGRSEIGAWSRKP
jgi:ubiquinone/menaquinone biosynthesis C-methylase UbiE